MDVDEYVEHDGLGLAELVRRREVTPPELVQAAIAQIERTNPKLNAVVTTTFELALASAQQVVEDAVFAGVPYFLKDIFGEYAGVRQTHGSRAWGEFVPASDSDLVTRHRAAGLVLVGKTNSPEFGLDWVTEPQRYGPTRNPWDLRRSPGGSSGGSAAAVAARCAPIGHANDGGGSTRIPAGCCGLFGLKPTRSRNPLRPATSDLITPVVSEHAVTRSVRDSAALLDATAGPSPGDPYVAPAPAGPYLAELQHEPGPLRIAWSTTPFTGAPVHSDCVEAVHDSVRLCESLGHDLTEASPTVDADTAKRALTHLWLLFAATSVHGVKGVTGFEATEDTVEPQNWAMSLVGSELRAIEHIGALETLQDVLYAYGAFFARYDALLTPTLAVLPPEIGANRFTAGEDPRAHLERSWWPNFPFTPLINVTGQPAMSVPLHWNRDGLPVGVQFVGRFGREDVLFRLAAQLERARPWAQRVPPTARSADSSSEDRASKVGASRPTA